MSEEWIFWDGKAWRPATMEDAKHANIAVKQFEGTGRLDPDLTVLTTKGSMYIVKAMHARFAGKDETN